MSLFGAGIAGEVNLGVGNLVGAFLGGLEGHEGIEERDGNLGLAFVADHEGLLGGVADEAHLGEHRGAGGLVEHKELGLLHTAVDGLEVLLVLVLDGLGQVEALVDERVLEHGQHDEALGSVGVEALVGIVALVVGLQEDVGVLLLGHLEVGTALGETHHEGLDARGGGGGVRVGMDGDEEVGFVAIGDMGTLGEGDVDVGGAGVDDLHVGVVVGNKLAELLGDGQGDVLLLGATALGAGFGSAMTRIDDHCTHLISVFFL